MQEQAFTAEHDEHSGAAPEKRQFQPRVPAHMSAHIVAPGQYSPAPCVVREFSQAGGKIHIEDGWIVPPTFWLLIQGDTVMHYCKVIWREGLAMGVEFPPGHSGAWWRYTRTLLNNGLPTRARV